MMTPSVNLLATGLNFPEGPTFAPDGSLWAVELKAGNLLRWRNGSLERIAVGGTPNGLAVDAGGCLWVCDAGRGAIRLFDPATGAAETVLDQVEGEPLLKPNDLAFDGSGNLVFTCPGDSRQDPTGYVVALTRSGDAKKIATGLRFPNGLAFSADGNELIVAETYRQRLWRGRWNAATAEWLEPRVWRAETGGAPGPDGMAFDVAGNLHVAIYGYGGVRVVAPGGEFLGGWPTPGRNPTNCAFDPAGRLGLVVTEAERGELLSFPQAPLGIRLAGLAPRVITSTSSPQ